MKNQQIINVPENSDVKISQLEDKVIIEFVPKKPVYPKLKSWAENCTNLLPEKYTNAYDMLRKLYDAYLQVVDRSKEMKCYLIPTLSGRICLYLFIEDFEKEKLFQFPTEEEAQTFFEHYKDEFEVAKYLL